MTRRVRARSRCARDTEAFNAAFAATGTEEAPAARRRWAQTHLDQAEIYDQLAAAEPTVADDHHTDAAKQRAIAAEITRDQERTP